MVLRKTGDIEAFTEGLERHTPHIELSYYPWHRDRTPYKTLVSEILLTKTSADKVAEVFSELIEKYPEPCDLAGADISNLYAILYPLGLRKRTEMLLEAMRSVCYDFASEVPSDLSGLLSLRGVGPYTASAVSCFAFCERVPIVDAGIARVIDRYFGGPTARGRSLHLDPTVGKYAREFIERYTGSPRAGNYALLDVARKICTPRKPRCSTCPLNESCSFARNVVVESTP